MNKNKILILITGSIVLAILSAILILTNQPVDQTVNNPTTESNSQASDDTTNGSTGSSNPSNDITNSNNIDSNNNNNTNVDSSESNESLLSAADEIIASHSLHSSASNLSQQSLYDQSYLYQQFYNEVSEFELTADELTAEEDAEWVSLELYAWLNEANQNYNFDYSEEGFIRYVNNEEYLTNSDEILLALLESLENESEELFIRQLEVHYLKPYIWSEIEGEVISEYTNINEEPSNESAYFYYFEDKIMEQLVEQNPDFFQAD